jgi:thiol-disulfide isomerase/thioredoxin
VEQKPSNTATWWVLGTVLVSAWIVYVVAFLPRPGSERLSPPALEAAERGARADYSWKLEDLDGRPFDLGAFRGKMLFLNIWATWCGPCVAEMPSINNLATDPSLKDLAVVCVSVDDSLRPVQGFVEQNKLKMTVAHAVGMVPDVFATNGIPATFLVAPDGQVLARQEGSSQWDTPDMVQRLIKAIQEHPPAK